MPIDVLISILDHRDQHNDDERRSHSRFAARYRYLPYHLHAHNYEEIDVGGLAKLLEQIDRKE